jgi:hypothetical protein
MKAHTNGRQTANSNSTTCKQTELQIALAKGGRCTCGVGISYPIATGDEEKA